MKKTFSLTTSITLIALLGVTKAYAVPIDAAVSLSGSNFLQSFTVANNSTAGLSIAEIVYDLGAAADGIATWNGGAGPFAGGIKSNFLAGSTRWGQTITWSGLSVGAGSSFSVAPFTLDIDLIATLSPLSVNEAVIDEVGSSLANASFGVLYDNGTFASVALNQTGWRVDQNLRITDAVSVPEPNTISLLLMAFALLAGSRLRVLHR